MAELWQIYYRGPEDPWKEMQRRAMEDAAKTPDQREAERLKELEACARDIQRLERELMAARTRHRKLQGRP